MIIGRLIIRLLTIGRLITWTKCEIRTRHATYAHRGRTPRVLVLRLQNVGRVLHVVIAFVPEVEEWRFLCMPTAALGQGLTD